MLLAGSPAFATTELVTNGDFATNGGNGELGDNTTAAGWTFVPSPHSYVFLWNAGPGVSGTTADTTGADGVFGTVWLWGPGNGSDNHLTLSPDGNAFIGSNPAFRNSPIEQTLSGLKIGVPVVVTFDWAGAQQHGFSGPTSEGWDVSLGASAPQSTGEVHISSHGFSGWQTASFTFTPTSTSEVLKFMAIGSASEVLPPFALLDSVSAKEVPELSTWAMMALGFLGLAYAGFRSNRRKPAAFA